MRDLAAPGCRWPPRPAVARLETTADRTPGDYFMRQSLQQSLELVPKHNTLLLGSEVWYVYLSNINAKQNNTLHPNQCTLNKQKVFSLVLLQVMMFSLLTNLISVRADGQVGVCWRFESILRGIWSRNLRFWAQRHPSVPDGNGLVTTAGSKRKRTAHIPGRSGGKAVWATNTSVHGGWCRSNVAALLE